MLEKEDLENLDKLRTILDEGWQMWFTRDHLNVHRGDSNCHIAKEYDPLDGHGYSSFEVKWDDLDVFDDFVGKIWNETRKIVEKVGK
jgi:hypothetical protein